MSYNRSNVHVTVIPDTSRPSAITEIENSN